MPRSEIWTNEIVAVAASGRESVMAKALTLKRMEEIFVELRNSGVPTNDSVIILREMDNLIVGRHRIASEQPANEIDAKLCEFLSTLDFARNQVRNQIAKLENLPTAG